MTLDVLLQESATTYRGELLGIPAVVLEEETAGVCTVDTGIQSEDVIGQIFVDPKFGPYKSTPNKQTGAVKTKARRVRVYVGQTLLEEDKQDVQRLHQSIAKNYRSSTTAEHPLEKIILIEMMKKIGEKQALNLYSATRDETGDDCDSLFDGFDTISSTEITAGTISESNKNLFDAGTLTESNIGNVIRHFIKSRLVQLRKSKTAKLVLPYELSDMYNQWCLDNLGSVLYNKVFDQQVVHSNLNIGIRWVAGKDDSSLMTLTSADNAIIGTDEANKEAGIEVRRGDNPNKIQFIYTGALGVQYASIEPEVFSVAQFNLPS